MPELQAARGRRPTRGRVAGCRQRCGRRGRGDGRPGRADPVDGDSDWVDCDEVMVDEEPELEDPALPSFTARNVGPKNIPVGTEKPLDFFSLYMSDDIITTMVTETNK